MNRIKKTLAIVLVLVIVAALPAPVFAAVTDEGVYSLGFSVYDAVSDGKYVYASGSSSEYRVYRIDIESGEMDSIGFSNGRRAESLYIHEGKLFVGLCDREHSDYWPEDEQTGAFAIIDTATFILEREVIIDIDPFDIVVSNGGIVYITSGSGQWTSIKAYTQNGIMIDSQDTVFQRSTIEYNPVLDRIYRMSFMDMYAYNLNDDGSLEDCYRWPYLGGFKSTVNYHITPEGDRILNGYGYSLGLSSVSDFDMVKLEDFDISFGDVDFDVNSGLAYFAADDGIVYAYKYDSLTPFSVLIPASGAPEFVFVCDGGIALITSWNNNFYFETISEDSMAGTLSFSNEDVINYVADNGFFCVDATNYESVVIILPLLAIGSSNVYVDTDGGEITFPSDTIDYLYSEYGNYLYLYLSDSGLDITEVIGGYTILDDPDAPFYIEIPYELTSAQNPLCISMVSDGTLGEQKVPVSGYDNGIVVGRVNGSGNYGVSYDPKTYSDISGHWGEKYIDFTSARDLFSGMGEGKFAPDLTMSRAMFVTVLYRIADIDTHESIWPYFNDVDADAWYKPAVNWAYEAGLVNGVGDGRFDPDAPVTREQMARLISLFMEYSVAWPAPLDSVKPFADEDSISDWAYYEVMEIQYFGLINGKPGNIFDPQGSATRAEVATILTRYLGGLIDIRV